MAAPLTLAVAQPSCEASNVAANAALHAAVVRAASARVVVFPELSLTGYELDAPPLDPADPRFGPLVAACRDTGSIVLAGAPVADDAGRIFIGLLAIDGAGARVAYRKMWLGGAETERFSPGPAPAGIAADGWRLGLAICRDTGIPQHAAETAALGIDAYVAGVLEAAADGLVPEQRAKRIAAEHHVWVAIASFAGSTGGGYNHAAGGSGIWTSAGQVAARCGPEVGAVARATLT